jgi:hypothetical protein
LVLNAVGGDCLEDFEHLREDPGLAEMLGHAVPSPEAARKFLYQFHEPEKIKQAQRELPMVIESWKREAKRRKRAGADGSATRQTTGVTLLSWLRNEKREGGQEGFIGFAVSARMNPALREEIEVAAL